MYYIDAFLNNITMYRLVLYGLSLLTAIALFFGFVGVLPLSGIALLDSLIIILSISFFTNLVCAKIFNTQNNQESSLITALILFFILTPPTTINQAGIVVAIAALAQISKYLLALHKKHLFNPVAITLVIAGFSGSVVATWWVGTRALLFFVVILGLLIVRKLRRFHLLFAFLGASIVTAFIFALANSVAPAHFFSVIILPLIVSSPLFFFGTIMLTEPLTTPPTKKLQIIYGSIVGCLFASQWQFMINGIVIYPTPELSLIIGNIFAYIVSSKYRLQLVLKEKNKLSEQIYEFIFSKDPRFTFTAGQYLEWTLPHDKTDDRGVRRYFTIASAPSEQDIKIGIRVFPESSSFKNTLTKLSIGDIITAGNLSGDFTLPQDPTLPLAFIAGGIGVTSFRSQIKELINRNQKRDIVLLYSANSVKDFVYTDIFKEAEAVGIKTVYIIADTKNIPANWTGQTGFITQEMIQQVVPDFKKRVWYLSGPNAMVENYKKLLKTTGVATKQIKTDYFPGF